MGALWYAEHISWGSPVAILCAAGAAHAGPSCVCFPYQCSAQPVVKREAGKAGDGGHLVWSFALCTSHGFVPDEQPACLAKGLSCTVCALNFQPLDKGVIDLIAICFVSKDTTYSPS